MCIYIIYFVKPQQFPIISLCFFFFFFFSLCLSSIRIFVDFVPRSLHATPPVDLHSY